MGGSDKEIASTTMGNSVAADSQSAHTGEEEVPHKATAPTHVLLGGECIREERPRLGRL